MNPKQLLWIIAVSVTLFHAHSLARSQQTRAQQPRAQQAQAESADRWFRQGQEAVARAEKLKPITGQAKQVILFIGDGMSITTVTAARILEGQQQGQWGEENHLSFEALPYTAWIKTYNTNQQVPDSAGTMSAIVTGVKTKAGVLSVDQSVIRGDYALARGKERITILELAERAGLSTGVVTTSRVTDATPAACYAHSPERNWENDRLLPVSARTAGFADIARQLMEFPFGDGLEVVLGGGRSNFLPSSAKDSDVKDSQNTNQTGQRLDARDLTAEWARKTGAVYVVNRSQWNAVDTAKTDHLLGLFEPGAMKFECDRQSDKTGEPSLSEMTAKAIDLLSKNTKGYFLMVEGGRIDHGHHLNSAYRALTDTIEFAHAVRVAMNKTDRRETLLIVTADHSHVFTMGGYPTRGNKILGKVVSNDLQGHPARGFALDALGRPYTTLGYANGPGYTGASQTRPEGPKHFPPEGVGYAGISKGRPDLSSVDTTSPRYLFECTVPLPFETHSGEDVPLYADGPMAYLFHGVLEQNVIFHVMAKALGLTQA